MLGHSAEVLESARGAGDTVLGTLHKGALGTINQGHQDATPGCWGVSWGCGGHSARDAGARCQGCWGESAVGAGNTVLVTVS